MVISFGSDNIKKIEPIAKLEKTVTPAKAGVQKTLKRLDSGLRRNDNKGLLQEPRYYEFEYEGSDC